MGKDAHTYIVDHAAASHSLASMAARAEVLDEAMQTITGQIAGLEQGKPWGTAPEYGGEFEKVYHAGGDGAEFVRQNAKQVATLTSEGVTTAHQALQGSIELDADGASLFRTSDTDAAGKHLRDIRAAVDKQVSAPATE